MDILEEGKVAVIEDVTFPAIKAPLWIVILSSIPPKINQILFYVTFTNLTYGYHLKRDVLLILLSDIESFNIIAHNISTYLCRFDIEMKM